MDCCDPNGLNRVFAGRLVARELHTYWRKGLNRRQRKIVAQLEPMPAEATVLDVGCGIGAVGTALLLKGAGKATFVDVSATYLRAAQAVSRQAGVEKKATFHQDDFATATRDYPRADVVVLDRVVCCYPDAAALLETAARHSQQTLVFTYPRPLWFASLFRVLCALGMKLFGQEYRFFLHNPKQLLEAATHAGHVQVATYPVGLWQLVEVSKYHA